jgi:hypothetical protein
MVRRGPSNPPSERTAVIFIAPAAELFPEYFPEFIIIPGSAYH